MRILLLTHTFNSLTQRLLMELTDRAHEVAIEFDINDTVTTEAVDLYRPDLIVAPYLRRAIPENIWRRHVCLVVHPGVKGDRGPSSLDWAIMNGEKEWGCTVLQATGVMDGGDIWASVNFPMRAARKSSLYRNEVIEAATRALLLAIARFEKGAFTPGLLDHSREDTRGTWHPLMTQEIRAIDWRRDGTATVLKKIRASDSSPGVLDQMFGASYYLYNAYPDNMLKGVPGEIIAVRHGAICRATLDGAVWITHLKPKISGEKNFKLPAAMALGERLRGVPESPMSWRPHPEHQTYQDIRYEEVNHVGYLHFDFYNGAMSTEQCSRLREAYLDACRCDTRLIVLFGGPDFWSNGIHLNVIEAAMSPADESWRNINAMNDLAHAIITTETHLTIAALQGNAGAGGVFLALAADRVYARSGVVLNPHYKGMGNLYGSEYWTYLLPKRVGEAKALELTENRLPIGAKAAKQFGFIDDYFGSDVEEFRRRIVGIAEHLADHPEYTRMVREKKQKRVQDEGIKPLEQYRAEELKHMHLNFYGFDPSYHIARYNFVYKVSHSWTPLYLATHRHKTTARKQRICHETLGPDRTSASGGNGAQGPEFPRAF